MTSIETKRKLKTKKSTTYFTLVWNITWTVLPSQIVGLFVFLCSGFLFCLTNCTSLVIPSTRIEEPINRNAYCMRLSFVTFSKLCSLMVISVVDVVPLFSIAPVSVALNIFDEDNKGRIIQDDVAAKSEKTNMAPCITDGLLFPITIKHSVDTAEINQIYDFNNNWRLNLIRLIVGVTWLYELL